jgi:ATP-dependent Lon protease
MTFQAQIEQEISRLRQKIEVAQLPPELREKVDEMLQRLVRIAQAGSYTEEYERVAHYIDWIVALPWNKRTHDVLDLEKAKQILDKNHYGMEEVKERILEYLSVLKLRLQKQEASDTVVHAPIICLVGLVGTGKTTFAYSLAEAMGRKLARIPFGGMGSARDLRGQSRLHLEAEPGHIIKALRRVKIRNPIILLDEIDRVSEDARADIMGVLVELLDPEQNFAFVDHYVDFPFNLSEVLFIATANNTTNIARAVMDRLEPLSMPSYSDKEKIVIGKDYLLPRALEEAGLSKDNINIEAELWPQIVRPLGYDAGIRTLQRSIKGIVRKFAKLKVQGQIHHLNITQANIKDYLSSY